MRNRIWTLGLMALLASCTGEKGGDKAALPPPKEGAAQPAADAQKAPEPPKDQQASTTTDAAQPSPAAAPAAPVAANPGTATATAVELRFTGSVDAPRTSQLAFRQTGFISEIKAKPGTFAKKGDVLATLDDRDFVLRLELAKARLAQAKVQAESAEKEYQRELQLKKENASTASSMDKVKAAFDQAKLGVKLADLDVQTADLAVKDTRLTAPYDCVVAVQTKNEWENVQSGNAVLTVYDTAEPEITLSVPERMMGMIKIGSKLRISVPSAGYTGQGEVVRMVPVIAEKTRTFQVTARLSAHDTKVAPGSYAEASLNEGT